MAEVAEAVGVGSRKRNDMANCTAAAAAAADILLYRGRRAI